MVTTLIVAGAIATQRFGQTDYFTRYDSTFDFNVAFNPSTVEGFCFNVGHMHWSRICQAQ